VKRALQILLSIGVLIVSAAVPGAKLLRAQESIQGRVINGTTHQPVANQAVRLLVPQQGMQQVATTNTDAQGHFSFSGLSNQQGGFSLVEAEFQGAKFHAPIAPGASTAAVDLTVYEASSSASAIRVGSLNIMLGAVGSRAKVREEYTVENGSQPPLVYKNPKGTFRFHVAPGASPPTVTVAGLMNMPLPQAAQPAAKGEYVINYPLKPGPTNIAVEYEADYSPAKFSFEERVPYPIDHAGLFLFPARLSLQSASFQAGGRESANGLEIQRYKAENVPAGAPLVAEVSGEPATRAEMKPATEPASAEEQGGGGQQVAVSLNSISRLTLPILGGFMLVLLWALGVRIAREWPRMKAQRARQGQASARKLSAKADKLLNSMADLDELFGTGKIPEKEYWKDRLELKARVVEALKKSAASPAESYANRRSPR
jgi:hypothetical protein